MLPLLARAGCPRSPLLAGRTSIPRPLPGSTTFPRLSSSLTARTRTRPSLSLALPSTPTRALVVSSAHRSSPPHSAFSELVHPSPPPPPIAPPTILDTALPKWAEGAKPYLLLARVDKPIGSVLLYWPCAWSITMASTVNHLPVTTPIWYMSLFAVGAFIMRGAGCTINDMWDRKFDAAVERTRWRPLAAGTVTPFKALSFLGLQLSAGLAVLTQLNWYSIVLGASSLAFVTIYPFMKRVTYYPQIVFGLTFNWGTLLGWSAVAGAVDWTIALPMYFGGVAWGVAYDCIYAHQDKVDDVTAGVKSIALAFPDTSRALISTLSTGFVSSLALTGYLAGLSPVYYAISCGGAAAHLAWQCSTVNFDDRADCWKKFVSNGWLGGLIWLGIAADYVWQVVLGHDGKEVDGEVLAP
ncbi:4-HB polyprenyltransferase [Saitozyma sp. JCM 24511]|nr:4-HB polyprenyltransferase [Saitozyma sp. JCM 24511]